MSSTYPDDLIVSVKVVESRPLLIKTHQSHTGLKLGHFTTPLMQMFNTKHQRGLRDNRMWDKEKPFKQETHRQGGLAGSTRKPRRTRWAWQPKTRITLRNRGQNYNHHPKN